MLVADTVLRFATFPAEAASPFDVPEQVRPLLPDFVPDRPAPGSVLPPIELPDAQDTDAAAAGQRVMIEEVIFSGNSVMPDQILRRIAVEYEGRELSYADIQALRDAVMLAYVERGYVTSGAVINPQSVVDGRLEITIIEGVLARIEVEPPKRFRPNYFEKRLATQRDRIVNVHELETRLQLLQQDDRVKRIASALTPGKRRGEARLSVQIEEEEPRRFEVVYANDLAPTIGGQSVRLRFRHYNALGLGDRVELRGTIVEGLKEIDVSYELPLTARDTLLQLHFRQNESKVTDDVFDRLDIEGQSRDIGVAIRHPVYRTLHSSFNLFVAGEHSQSKSFLLGERFSFSAGPDDGVSRVMALRIGGDWVHRGPDQVVAARSVFSFGLDTLNATRQPGDLPDGQFISWLGQLQWARRFEFLDAQLIGRTDIHLSDSPLLGIEQYVVGGQATVRGYRENERVRDNAMIGSLNR